MLAFALNPGFLLIAAALIALISPRTVRPLIMGFAALAAIWLMLGGALGMKTAMTQMGLGVVTFVLDPLNRIFGIAMLIALIIIAIYSSARRNRYEDAAILLLAGGAVTTLFVGDLVSFVAAAEMAAFGASWVVFASPLEGANRAGVRLLVWHGLEGLLFLVGVALHLSAHQGQSALVRLDVNVIGDAFIFAALLVRVGAPIAHVWLKDAIAHASAAGAPALSAFTTMLGVYALARLFPAEPLLMPIGGAMVVIGALMGIASDDFRRSAAYGLMAVAGVCVMLVGYGSPLALAAAEGHAFAAIIAFVALQMALGSVVVRLGNAHAASLAGLAPAMPLSIALVLFAGIAVASVPGAATYATQAVALEATGQWDLRWVWMLIAATPAALFIAFAMRPALVAHRVTEETRARATGVTPYPMALGTAIAAFFCFSVGVAPGWLYGLMPTELAFQPFDADQLPPQLEMLGVAGVVYIIAWSLGLAPRERPMALLDLDSLYRGPVAAFARWTGVLALRVYGAGQVAIATLGEGAGRGIGRLSRTWDRPYKQKFIGFAQFMMIAGILLLFIIGREL
ncbi:MAG: proton-conducting transporter membrane subunit [Terricaulis sp.]